MNNAEVNFPTPHCHIQSLDSASTPERFASRELALGTGYVTVTDHGTLEATREVYDLCQKKQYNTLRPILGVEGYFRDDNCPILTKAGIEKVDGLFRKHIKYTHITLHALDEAGYSAISRLLSQADLRAEKHGSERKPLFDWANLEELGSYNVTGTSGCLIGMVSRHLLAHNDPHTAIQYYEKVRSAFQPGNFYVEMFPHVCDRNWESKVVITDTQGRKHDFFPYKKLKFDNIELKAEELIGNTTKLKGQALRAVMNQRSWTEIEPFEFQSVEAVEGFVQNECRPWAANGDVQLGVNKFLLRLAMKYKDPILVSDDCLVAGTLVRTEQGYLPIENIVPGTKVVSRLGTLETVEATRGLLSSKKIVRLAGRGWNVQLTEDHRVWCRPSHKWASGGYKQDFPEPQWVPAGEIPIGSWVFSPAGFQSEGTTQCPIDLSEYFTHNNSKYISVLSNTIESVSRVTKHRATYARYIEFDEELAFIVGLFLGDGNAHNNLVSFALDTETWSKVGSRLEDFVRRYSFSFDKKTYPGHVVFRIICSPLAQWFRKSFYVDKRKVAGPCVKLSNSQKWKVIEGLLWSDGTNRNGTDRDGKVNLSLTSLPAISWVRDFCLANGVWCSFTSRRTTGSTMDLYTIDFDENLFKFIEIWKTPQTQRQKIHVVHTDGGYWYRVTTVEPVDIRLPVYDLQVSGDHSFCTPHVTVHNCHFAYPKEKIVQDIRLAQHGGSWRFSNSHHRMEGAEAWEYFSKVMGVGRSMYEGWVENNRNWASRFREFKFSARNTLPVSFYPKDTLAHTMELINKHGRMDWSNKTYVDRLEQEINLLHRNGTVDLLPYFFIDEEVCRAYAANNLLTGPGRGSAAGLLLSYLLGITHIDPLRYQLSVDRFLTLDRIQTGKLPDIDQDLENREFLLGPEGREGTGWIYQRFGKCVAQISTNSTIKLKSAILDTFRARLGKVPDEIAAFSKSLPQPPQGISDSDYVFGYTDTDGTWQAGLFEIHVGLQAFAKQYHEEWEIVKLLLGLPRQKSRHPCALVISDTPVEEFIPLQTVGGVRVTAFTHAQVEAASGLKMDFLRVNSLRDISLALKLIRQRNAIEFNQVDEDSIRFKEVNGKKLYEVQALPFEGKIYDIWDLPERQEVFADICSGNVATVFQLDAGAAKQGLRAFAPTSDGKLPLDSIEKLSAFTALDRPGPLDAYVQDPTTNSAHNMLVEYANRAKGIAPIGELPILMQLIPETFGIIVYQEQLQAIFQSIGGTTAIEANNFRNRISKKKMVDVNKIDKPLFMKGALPKLGEKTAELLWSQMETFGQYGFNKSVDGTVILPYKGGFKQLQDFRGGEIVECVDETGSIVETEVVALHDHGQLEGIEVEFDDGYKTVVSANHKFLTQEGQRPLYHIVTRDLGVYARPIGDDQKPKVQPQEKVPTVPKTTSQARGTGTGLEVQMRAEISQQSFDEDSPSNLPEMQGNQVPERSGTATEAQPVTRTKGGIIGRGSEDFGSTRYPASESGEVAGLAVQESGTNAADLGFSQSGTKTIQDGSLAAVKRYFDLGRCGDSLRRDQETNGFCESGPQDLGGSRRVLALLREASREGAEERRYIESGVSTPGRCDIDPTLWAVFCEFDRRTQRGMENLAYSDAPLTSAGGLVLRRIIRIRSVGPKRMYDLEVAHPKHNYLMRNGVVTSNSHAACYMHVSYATAFLKHFYPLEWWTATLSNADRNEIDEKFWKYCGHLIKLPDIQYSGEQFQIEGEGIRAPLWLLAGIGTKAHEQLMLFKAALRSTRLSESKPSILDLLNWIDRWRIDNGSIVTKKNKKGEEQRVLKKATTALNATVIQNLIISGAFDSLFEPEDVTIEDKLKKFAFIYSDVCTHKFKSLAAVYDTSSRIVQFQLRKKVLPAFTDDIAELAREDHPDKFKGKAYLSRNEWHVLSTLSYERLSSMKILPDRDMKIAVVGYVTECRIFSYTNKADGSKKTAAELTIETEGHRSTFVKWPSKANGLSDSFLQVQKGSVVSCLFSRTNGRDFFFMDVEILTGPLSEPEPNEETPS